MKDFTLVAEPITQNASDFYYDIRNGYIQLSELVVEEDIEKIKDAIEVLQNLENFLDKHNLIDWM